MADTGLLSPSSASGWLNSSNVYVSDNNKAAPTTGSYSDGQVSPELIAGGFGMSIPTGATIDGIELKVECRGGTATGNGWNLQNIRLRSGGANLGSDKGSATELATTDTVLTFGGASDTWGRTWTPAEINAADFGSALTMRNQSGFTSALGDVDHIQIRVYYTEGSSTVSAAGAFSGSGSLSGQATKTAVASGAFTGSGSLSAQGGAIRPAGGAFTGSGSLSGSAGASRPASGSLTGSGSLSGAAQVKKIASGDFSGSGTLSGSAVKTAKGSGEFSGAGTLSGSGLGVRRAAGDFSGSGSLSGSAYRVRNAAGAFSGTGSLSGAAQVTATKSGSGAFTGSGTLSGQPSATFRRSGSFAGSGALSGSAAISGTIKHGSGGLDGGGALAGEASVAGANTSRRVINLAGRSLENVAILSRKNKISVSVSNKVIAHG